MCFQLDTTFVVLLSREECFVRYIVWNSQESYKGMDVDGLISYDIGIVCIFLNALPTQMPERRRAKKKTNVSSVLLLHSSTFSPASASVHNSRVNHYLSSDPMNRASIP